MRNVYLRIMPLLLALACLPLGGALAQTSGAPRVSGDFLAYWQRHGGLPVFGFPIVSMREERSATDGQPYLTQWFERERMEYHPENAGTPYEVLLGLLGSEELRARGYLP